MTVVRLPQASDTHPDPRPKVLHAYRRNAPKRAPCPHCGRLGRRKDFHERLVRSIAYKAVLLLHVTTAEYRATCACSATFRTQIAGVQPKAHYDNQVREAVLDRLLDDRMTVQQIQHALQRDFYFDLSSGFLYDCLDWNAVGLKPLVGALLPSLWTFYPPQGPFRSLLPPPHPLRKHDFSRRPNRAPPATTPATSRAPPVSAPDAHRGTRPLPPSDLRFAFCCPPRALRRIHQRHRRAARLLPRPLFPGQLRHPSPLLRPGREKGTGTNAIKLRA
jgi:hypothetical protein